MRNPLNAMANALGGNFNALLQEVMLGKMQGTPMMQQFNGMMNGKSREEQIKTLLNSAESMGIDINEKCFTKSQLANLGINIGN